MATLVLRQAQALKPEPTQLLFLPPELELVLLPVVAMA
jgi:hypothetical protein